MPSNAVANGTQEPALKKRKLEDGTAATSTDGGLPPVFSMKDVSFSMPQRKKLNLELAQQEEEVFVRGRNTSNGAVEFGAPMKDFSESSKATAQDKGRRLT